MNDSKRILLNLPGKWLSIVAVDLVADLSAEIWALILFSRVPVRRMREVEYYLIQLDEVYRCDRESFRELNVLLEWSEYWIIISFSPSMLQITQALLGRVPGDHAQIRGWHGEVLSTKRAHWVTDSRDGSL